MIASAVILAAGLSTRFPGNKLIAEVTIDGFKAPLIRHTVSKFLRSRVFDEVVVVVGYEYHRVIESLRNVDIKFIINWGYSEGMSSSVKVGVKSVMKYSDIVAIHPGDVPYVKVDTLRLLFIRAQELLSVTDKFIVIPKYSVKGGHPLIISRKLLPDVLTISEKCRGLKGFLRNNFRYVHYVQVNDLGVLRDIDRPEDLVR